jgi:hypothetical protein
MILRKFIYLTVAVLALNGAFASATSCKDAAKGKVNSAVADAIKIAEGQRAAAEKDMMVKAAKLGITVPAEITAKIDVLIQKTKTVDPTTGKPDASARENWRESCDKIAGLLVDIINLPSNQKLFKKFNETLDDRNTFKYLLGAPDADLQSRIVLAVANEAYVDSLIMRVGGEKVLNGVHDASVAFEILKDTANSIRALKEVQKGEFGNKSVEELKARLRNLNSVRGDLIVVYLDNVVLPAEVNTLIDRIAMTATTEMRPNTFQDEVLALERKLAPHWQLTKLWSKGWALTTRYQTKEAIKEGLRQMVIDDNRKAFMPEGVYQDLVKMEAHINELNLILSTLR